MDPPSARVSGQGPDWFLVATEACSGETPNLGSFLEVWVFIGIFGAGLTSGGSPSHPRDRGRAQGGRARPPPSWAARDSSGPTLLLWGLLLVHKKLSKLARQLDSVWYSCSVELKNKEKTETGTGLQVNRLVPKII